MRRMLQKCSEGGVSAECYKNALEEGRDALVVEEAQHAHDADALEPAQNVTCHTNAAGAGVGHATKNF